MPSSTTAREQIAELKSRKAGLTRHRGANDPDVVAVADDLRRAVLEARIQKLVDEAPPLSAAQRDRLALLLRGDAA